jgi:DNA-binding response OmpR family regulator
VRAVLRRRVGPGPAEVPWPVADTLRFGRLEIDRGAREVRVDGVPRPLTSHQFELLVALAGSAGRVLSREQLMERVRGEPLDAFDRSIDVHVGRIRAAIEDDPRHPRRILTVRGAGYVFPKSQDAG